MNKSNNTEQFSMFSFVVNNCYHSHEHFIPSSNLLTISHNAKISTTLSVCWGGGLTANSGWSLPKKLLIVGVVPLKKSKAISTHGTNC